MGTEPDRVCQREMSNTVLLISDFSQLGIFGNGSRPTRTWARPSVVRNVWSERQSPPRPHMGATLQNDGYSADAAAFRAAM